MKLMKRAGLETIEYRDEIGAKTVVMLHGYGATAEDLVPLREELSNGKEFNWVFVQAPMHLPYGGRAWFEIDFEAIQKVVMAGGIKDYSTETPMGFFESREKISKLIQDLGTPLEKIIIGGFSQGAMMSSHVAGVLPSALGGVSLLSGALLAEKELRKTAVQVKGMPFYQSHGHQDAVLHQLQAKSLSRVIQDCGWKGECEWFQGGHDIPPHIGENFGRFLSSL